MREKNSSVPESSVAAQLCRQSTSSPMVPRGNRRGTNGNGVRNGNGSASDPVGNNGGRVGGGNGVIRNKGRRRGRVGADLNGLLANEHLVVELFNWRRGLGIMAETYKVQLIVDGGRNGNDLGDGEGDGRDGDDDEEKMGGTKTVTKTLPMCRHRSHMEF